MHLKNLNVASCSLNLFFIPDLALYIQIQAYRFMCIYTGLNLVQNYLDRYIYLIYRHICPIQALNTYLWVPCICFQ